MATLQRAVITASFFVTKQPARIKQVLQQVYPVYPERADDILVASIQQPAQHPDAAQKMGTACTVLPSDHSGVNRALAVCDVLYARHTKARWFALHVIANGWIALLCLPDLYAIATDPLDALTKRETVNHWPTSPAQTETFYVIASSFWYKR